MYRNKKLLSVISTFMIFTFFATPSLALTDAILDSTKNVESINGLGSNYTTINTVKQDNVGVETKWTKFNVKTGETLDTNFQGQNQTFLIKVTGVDMSKIHGVIKSSGVGAGTSSTTMINPNGWYVGPGGLINVNSLLMTTQDFVNTPNGRDLVDGAGNGLIRLEGANVITAEDALFVASQALVNNSNITAGGKVQLVTADGMNFDLQQSGNISLASSLTKASSSKAPALSVNNSNITGKTVEMAARTDGVNPYYQSVVIAGKSAIKATNGDIYVVAKADSGASHIGVNDASLIASDTVSIKNYDGNISLKNLSLNPNNAKTRLETLGDNNINLNNICVKGGELRAIAVDGDINMTASSIDNSNKTNFTTSTGDIHLTNTKIDNSSTVELRNFGGLIGVGNVDVKNSSSLDVLSAGKVNVANLNLDSSKSSIVSTKDDVSVYKLTNANFSATEVRTNDGKININDATNTNNSTLNVYKNGTTTASDIYLDKVSNAADSTLNVANKLGKLHIYNTDVKGKVKFDVEDKIHIEASNIDTTIANSKAKAMTIAKSTFGANAKIDNFDGDLFLGNVTADPSLKTASVSNKNGDMLIVKSSFNDLEATSTGNVDISTTTADKMTIDADNILVHNLTNNTLINNAKAKGNAQFEGDGVDAAKGGVKFNNITAGGKVVIHGGTIETENKSGTINAGTSITMWTENQDVNLQSLNGATLDVDFEGNEVLATNNGFFDIQTSDRQTLTIDQKLDDKATGFDRDFILGAGQIVYPRTGHALKTAGAVTLIDKKDDIDVRVSSNDADTISLDNFDVGQLNVWTDGANSGDIYVYMPIASAGVPTSFDAKAPSEFVYYIYPPAPTVNGDDEVNKISTLAGDLSSQAPVPVALGNLIPLGAAAKFDANAKKHFVSIEEGGQISEYRVLKGLPYASDNKDNKREIY